MQGPVTVFDDGVYAGDARIPDLPAGGERLLSYAMDLDVALESLEMHDPEADVLLPFLAEMEFRTLTKRVADKMGVVPPEITEVAAPVDTPDAVPFALPP